MSSTGTLKASDLAYTAIGAALIAICSWISIPTTVPFTMQTFAIFLLLSVLGGKRGLMAVGVYLLLGAVGIPVFAQFTAGLGILLGNTGGYMMGFIFMGLIYWLAERFMGKKPWLELLAMVTGLAALYAFGTAWFMVVYARENGAVGLGLVLSWCVAPFVLPDLVKLALAVALSRRIAPALKMRR